MVKVSKLRSLDIYTNTGHYVGRVEDVVLAAMIQKYIWIAPILSLLAGVINSFLGSIRGEVPEENDMKSFKDDVLTVDFDKVQAIGDIMLINPRDIRRNQEPQVPDAVVPKQPETQPQEKQVQFDAERA